MAVQLLFFGVLLPGVVQNSIQYPCVVPIYFFFKRFVSVQVAQTNNSIESVILGLSFHYSFSQSWDRKNLGKIRCLSGLIPSRSKATHRKS